MQQAPPPSRSRANTSELGRGITLSSMARFAQIAVVLSPGPLAVRTHGGSESILTCRQSLTDPTGNNSNAAFAACFGASTGTADSSRRSTTETNTIEIVLCQSEVGVKQACQPASGKTSRWNCQTCQLFGFHFFAPSAPNCLR